MVKRTLELIEEAISQLDDISDDLVDEGNNEDEERRFFPFSERIDEVIELLSQGAAKIQTENAVAFVENLDIGPSDMDGC